MLFKVQKSDGGFDGLFGGDVGHTNQILLHHIFLSKVLPIIDDCTKSIAFQKNIEYNTNDNVENWLHLCFFIHNQYGGVLAE